MTRNVSSGAVVAELARLVPDGSAPAAQVLDPAVGRATAAWPAAVLARCVVLLAHEQGGPRALRPVGTPAVVGLWQSFLDEVLSWPTDAVSCWLDAPRAVVVRCGTAAHRLVLVGSTLVARSHQAVDLELEQVAVAMGAEASGCLGVQAGWPRPGPARGPVATLAWLDLVRAWQRAGVDLGESAPAVEEQVAPADVAEHLRVGLDLVDAVRWRAVDAAEAVRWQQSGATPRQARAWSAAGRPVEDLDAGAGRLQECAVPRGTALRLLLSWSDVRPSLDLGGLLDWIGCGREASTWGEVALRGVPVAEAAIWHGHGFGPVEVLRYRHLRVPVDVACAWRRAGVTARVAAQHIADGTPLALGVRLAGVAPAPE